MSFDGWLGFAIPTLLICITPGPNMMLMLAVGLRRGLLGTIPAMVGALSAVLAMMVASALGLGLILQQSPRVFMLVKTVGAAYLAYLGLQLIFGERKQPVTVTAEAMSQGGPSVSLSRSQFWDTVRKAMAVAGSNPKAIAFAAAYFPQFIDPNQVAWPQLAVVLPTFIVLETACYVLYASSGQGLANWFAKPAVLRRFNVAIGIIFIAFGVLLAIN